MNETELLSQILANNIGQKLTLELAHGIVSVFNQSLPKPREKKKRMASTANSGVVPSVS